MYSCDAVIRQKWPSDHLTGGGYAHGRRNGVHYKHYRYSRNRERDDLSLAPTAIAPGKAVGKRIDDAALAFGRIE